MTDEIRLATDQDDGQTVGIEITGFANLLESHLRTLFVWGTFDSATLIYQVSHNSTDGIDGDWFDVANADAITVKTVINVEHRARWHRVSISGSTTVASLNAVVI